VTLALGKLAERGSLMRHEDEWLITEPPVAPVSTEPKAPQLLLTAPRGAVWAARDPVEQGPEELRMLIRQLAQTHKEFAQDQKRRARKQAEEARAMRERARRSLPDAGHSS